LIQDVDAAYGELEPTKAARAIQEFTIDELSNWHVRLSRRRFWKGEMSEDKLSAYQTLHECLKTLAIMASPIAPFYCDRLHHDINPGADSVHLMAFPEVDAQCIDQELEERMKLAQQISSQALSLRKREKIRVRQPLRRILVPVLDETVERRIRAVEQLICGEINVKNVELLKDESDSEVSIVKRVKPDFKALGPRFGKRMKSIAAAVNALDADGIMALERNGEIEVLPEDGQGPAVISTSDVDIMTDDIPGWLVSSASGVTVALDITLDEELRSEGIARELINRVQNVRKDHGLEVTDKIKLTLDASGDIRSAIEGNLDYIRVETLADVVSWQTAQKWIWAMGLPCTLE
jgi:isoleucyl-tRNA synthetase